jgi:hypothetical protein
LFLNISEVNAETKYIVWLQECYEDTFMRLLSIMSKHKPSMQLQALSTMMKLISLEGKYPIDYRGKEEYYFPVQKLRVSIFPLCIFLYVCEKKLISEKKMCTLKLVFLDIIHRPVFIKKICWRLDSLSILR